MSKFYQAESSFRSAKCYGNPLMGFQAAGFRYIQALLLMSVNASRGGGGPDGTHAKKALDAAVYSG